MKLLLIATAIINAVIVAIALLKTRGANSDAFALRAFVVFMALGLCGIIDAIVAVVAIVHHFVAK